MEETKNKIEEQDNDNIYVYSEYPDNDNPSGYADKHNLDDSGPNYSQVGNNDVDLSEDHYRESSDSFGSSPFFLMLKVLFSPIEGWKSVRRSKPGIEEMQQKCFYPLLGIYSLSKFMRNSLQHEDSGGRSHCVGHIFIRLVLLWLFLHHAYHESLDA